MRALVLLVALGSGSASAAEELALGSGSASIRAGVALGSGAASAAAGVAGRSPRLGWLTGAGVMLAGGGAIAVSLGAHDVAQGEAAARAVRAYYANGAAPTAAEASTVRWLQERSERLCAMGLALLVAGGAALVVGISMGVFDGLIGATPVSLAIRPGAGAVELSGTF